jgi:hypothetical protein
MRVERRNKETIVDELMMIMMMLLLLLLLLVTVTAIKVRDEDFCLNAVLCVVVDVMLFT